MKIVYCSCGWEGKSFEHHFAAATKGKYPKYTMSLQVKMALDKEHMHFGESEVDDAQQ